MAEHESGEVIPAGPGQKSDASGFQRLEGLRAPAHEHLVRLRGVFQGGGRVVVHGLGETRRLGLADIFVATMTGEGQ